MIPARPDWSRVRHVLLDMDGTMLDLAFDNFIWRDLVPERYAAARKLSLAEARAELDPKFRAVAHTLPWYDTNYWSSLTGLDVAGLHREFRHKVAVLDGSFQFLDAVRESGRPIWVCTNAHPDSWRPKLEVSRMQHYFEHVISSHDMQAPKEDQRFWERLMERHPFDREHAMFCDDSPPVLASARTFGIGQIVAMRHPDTTAPPRTFADFPSVARLNELLPLI